MKYHVIIRETATHSSEWLTVDAENIDDAIAAAIDACGCERGFAELIIGPLRADDDDGKRLGGSADSAPHRF